MGVIYMKRSKINTLNALFVKQLKQPYRPQECRSNRPCYFVEAALHICFNLDVAR